MRKTQFAIGATVASSILLLSAGMGAVAAKNVSPSAKMGKFPLVLGIQGGSPGYTENFNPFSVNALDGFNYMYEPMYEVSGTTGQKTPWLATGYKWIGSKELQFTIRKGVKWSNGKPFTAQDVVFTFNLLKKYPALDVNGVWQYLQSVSASKNVVTFHFSKPNVPGWQYLATQVIVYPAQFTGVNPVKFTDTKPIVTGPYVLQSFNTAQYTLRVNPLYWQRSKIKVPAITEIALGSNETSDLQMSEGKFDAAVLFEPDIQKDYISKNPKEYHYWFPLSSPVSLMFNLTEKPFNNVKFRQAMAYAINREDIYKKGEYGYEPPANESLLPPTLDSHWLDKSLAKKYAYNFNPKKALSLLASIGYHKKNGKLIGPNGKQLSFTLEVPTGWTDYIQDMAIIQKELGNIGIKVNTETPSVSTDYNDVETGHFQATLQYGWVESNPYFIYNYVLSSSESAPIGQAATMAANDERFKDPTLNKLVSELAATSNVAKQHQLVDEIQQITFTKVPVVALVSAASWFEYQTTHYVGWPTAKNPYSAGFNLLTLIHLRPKK